MIWHRVCAFSFWGLEGSGNDNIAEICLSMVIKEHKRKLTSRKRSAQAVPGVFLATNTSTTYILIFYNRYITYYTRTVPAEANRNLRYTL